MSGMIGSRTGWIETSYIRCPTNIHGLAAKVVKTPDIYSHPTYIVPGITARSSSGDPDVMRGEETQVFGALVDHQGDSVLACIPGTHSKWIRVENRAISSFSTFMTNEIFAATRHCQSFSFLSNYFIFDKGAFLDAVSVSQRRGGLTSCEKLP